MTLNWDVGLAFGLSLAWAAWTLHVYWRHRPKTTTVTAETIIAYASQFGNAANLARQKFESLSVPDKAQLVSLAELSLTQLNLSRRAIFVVSTYGDGEAPDQARRFARELAAYDAPLTTLEYEVVALGDSRYPQFCQFGEYVDHHLARLGAIAATPMTRIDARKAESNTDNIAATLIQRERLNTTADEGLFRLVLAIEPSNWRAGDLVAIHPNNDTEQVPRRYSIASAELPNQLQLVVRQHRRSDGGLGLCSGWLTDRLELNDSLSLALIRHQHCHIDHAAAPLLLIGAGSGWAGIRGHLSERRANNSSGSTWLMFGERYPDASQKLHHDIQQWQLDRSDLAFSRSAIGPTYVQQLVRQAGSKIIDFLGSNGHIYVCGRHEGMGSAVDAELRRVLGPTALDAMVREQRYHRDLY